MAIPSTHKQERLHSAYIRAVVAHAEQTLVVDNEGDYGIDGTVRQIKHNPTKNKYFPTGYFFEFQLKATINCKTNKNGEMVYSLDDNAHYKFTQFEGVIPQILIVYNMPDDIHQCVIQSDQKLEMMGCCYWKLMDKTALQTKTVYIPPQQIFDAEAIRRILNYYGQELKRLTNVNSI